MHGVPDTKEHPRLLLQPFHKEVLDFIQDFSYKRKGVLMPRYFLKSTTITCSKPIWDWLNNHETRTMIVTETHKKAEDSLNFVKGQIMRNELLRYIYPEIAVDDVWRRANRWSNIAIDLPHRGIFKDPSIQVLGVGNAAQGIHVEHIYLDDIIGQKDMLSAIEAENTWKWFSNVEELLATPDVSKPHGSCICLIGTHYSPDDIYDKVKKSKLGYVWKTIPAEYGGEPTWPERLSAEEIRRYKENPERAVVYYTQMQNDPMHSGMTVFNPEWKKFYTKTTNEDGEDMVVFTEKIGDEVKTHATRVKELDISATIDPAFSSRSIKDACRTAIVIVGVHRKLNYKFILEAWAQKISEPHILYEKIFELHDKYRPRKWGIEAYGPQVFVYKAIREQAAKVGRHIPLRELPKDTGRDAKAMRIESLKDDFATGQIYMHEMQRDLIGEFHSFPIGLNDLLDALAYHKQWWRRVNTEEIEEDMRRREVAYDMKVSGITGYGSGYS